MNSLSSTYQDESLTPIAKATFSLSASLTKAKKLCKTIEMLIAIGAIVFFAASIIVWVLLLVSSIQDEIIGSTAVSLASFFLMGVFEAIGVMLAYRIFADLVQNEAIFTANQIKRLKGIALVFVVLFAIELVFPTSDMLLAGADAGYVGLASDNGVTLDMPTLNLGSLLFAAVFYCASAIFEYASLLQQASDETI